MLDPITRAAALLALAYRGDARHVAAQQAEVATLLGNVGARVEAGCEASYRVASVIDSPDLPRPVRRGDETTKRG